jgi:hypothetical protein
MVRGLFKPLEQKTPTSQSSLGFFYISKRYRLNRSTNEYCELAVSVSSALNTADRLA